MIFRTLLILTALTSLSFCLSAQDYSSFTCPVEVNGKVLKYPFTGGFNSPQFSKGDFNNDGQEELFVFDRGGQTVMIFEGDGTGGSAGYSYRADLKNLLPDSLVSWVLVRDYNRDNIPDLFVAPTFGGFSSIQLYVGSYENGELTFTIKQIGHAPDRADLIWYFFGSSWVNISVPFTDVPEVIDIDGDGDLDILSFDGGGSQVVYYKNMQVEDGLVRDEMRFINADNCFGKFKEAGTSGQIFLSNSGTDCADKKKRTPTINKNGGAHAGSTLMAYDDDADGDLELVLGDLSSNNLVMLRNGGDAENNYMTEVNENFPSYDLPANMDIFLSSFNVDVDGDGLKDILTSPNAVNSVQNVDNIWYYKNLGNTTNKFSYQQKNFLLEETIDLGSNSVPVFMDENADGLMDLMVATSGYFSNLGTNAMFLALYRNVGTATNPSFILIDEDYLSFSEYSTSSTNPAPTVGDIDNDGDMDILIADAEGSLYLFVNNAGEGNKMSFGNPLVNYMGIEVENRARPTIYDVNGDGLSDIIIGGRRLIVDFSDPDNPKKGAVAYYQNQGSIGNPSFNNNVLAAPNTPTLGNMSTQVTVSSAENNSSAPFFVTEGDALYAVLGSESGRIKRYLVDQSNLYNQFEVVDSIMGGLDEGSLTTLSMYDIDSDGFLEIAIGNQRGGVSMFNTTIKGQMVSTDDTTSRSDIQLYPNPATDLLKLSTPLDFRLESIKMYNSQGQFLRTYASSAREISISNLDGGVYYLVLETNEESITKKFVKL